MISHFFIPLYLCSLLTALTVAFGSSLLSLHFPAVPALLSALCPADPSCLLQELHLLVRHTWQQARARQQAQEHEAERLRIEIVKLREALDEETAARASLEGQLRVQREETGRVSWVRHGCQEVQRSSFDLSVSLTPTDVLQGE